MFKDYVYVSDDGEDVNERQPPQPPRPQTSAPPPLDEITLDTFALILDHSSKYFN